MGSPPRMRGKEDKKEPLCGSFGITPAYAGKSDAACIHGAVVGDHPRVCGEKWPAALYEEMERGITPAYAGKSFSSSSSFVLYWDHPRVCGEKVLPLWLCVGSSGSPPRMRGKAGPADAGRKQLRDHPRVCGEKPRTFSRRSPKPGSPPRMRGKGRKAAPSYLDLRITPAYAGKRLKRSRSTVPPVAIVPLFPSVCNKPVVSDGSPAGRDAPLFLPAENAVPASPAYNLRSL